MDILKIISSIRDSFIGAEHVYSNGSCYYFAKILHNIFPEGSLLENHDHVYFKLDDRLYDIRGEVNSSLISQLTEAREPTLHGKYDLFLKSVLVR